MDSLISRQAAISIPLTPKGLRKYQTCNLDDAYDEGWGDYQACVSQLPLAQLDLSEYSDNLWRNAYERGKRDAQPEPHGRIFQEIVVEYPSISTYPEYEGKPYFSIKYVEDGQGYIGYGTYNPKVLSEYLKEYFIQSAQLER